MARPPTGRATATRLAALYVAGAQVGPGVVIELRRDGREAPSAAPGTRWRRHGT